MMIIPGNGVRRNVQVHQLRTIIAKAKANGYGEHSATVLARATRELEQATADKR